MLPIAHAYDLYFQVPPNDPIAGRCLREAGEFARAELDVMQAMLAGRRGSYLDIGANIGAMSLPIAHRNADVHVTAVEASRHLATLLAGNVAINRLQNVDVIHAAAGAQAGLSRFPTPPLTANIHFGGLSLGQNEPGVPMENVRVCSLDEIARADTLLVKLDVEGFELEVMAGAKDLLSKQQASWVFEWGKDENSASLIQLFLDAGYDAYWLYAPFLTPQASLISKRSPSLKGDTNVLVIPKTMGGPPVPMTRIENAREQRPNNLSRYPYLKTYGFS